MKKFILIGDSGHAKVIEDCVNSCSDFEVIAKLDERYEEILTTKVITRGPVSILKDLLTEDCGIIVAIGTNKTRESIARGLGLFETFFSTIIHSSAIVSVSATIGKGTVIMPGAVINAGAIIGDHCIINTNSVVEHDCIIGDYVHISPGAILTGGVKVGLGTHVGAGVTVIPRIEIGEWSVIGAGATVISNVDSFTTAVGVPAKIVKREGK